MPDKLLRRLIPVRRREINMKKTISIITIITLVSILLCGCSVKVNSDSEETSVGIVNPWRDCTEDEAYQYAPNGFSAPEGATDIYWSMMLPDNDPARESDMLVQLKFTLDGIEYCAREQAVAEDGDKDISGMYYEWQDNESVTLANWAGGNMAATIRSFSGSDESAKLCMWYDIETGFAYTLSCSSPDQKAKDADIKSVAESIYDPDKQIGADATEIPETCPEEAADETLAQAAEEAAPNIDINGCDTFTQIVDSKLSGGMGYANEKIGDEDVLLVSSGTYDNLDGNMASIDAAVYIYKDGVPAEAGKVSCGGTAYPLSVKDGFLYVGSNHWICKYTIENGKLAVAQKAAVVYNEKGDGAYYYESADGVDNNVYDTVKTKAQFEGMFEELETAKIINFDTVGGSAGKLPAYEYPGPELFYTVLYQYLIDEFGPGYPESDVTIPCPIIIAEDESNRDDIRIWGDFWVLNYDLNGDILENTSGGSYPGCIHVKTVDDSRGYVVTGFDAVGDGSDYEPTAKKIFGKYYNDLLKSTEDTKGREETRAQIISNYVAANDLKITAYRDYGWDPVSLPPENIDSFYGFND